MVQYLNYFRALAEHNPDVESWSEFWKREKSEIRKNLSREQLHQFMLYPQRAVWSMLKEYGYAYPLDLKDVHPKFVDVQLIPKKWLTERIDVDQVNKFLDYKELIGDMLVDNERLRQEWDVRHKRINGSYEIWRFSKPPGPPPGLMGLTGFAFVRDGIILDSMTIMRS